MYTINDFRTSDFVGLYLIFLFNSVHCTTPYKQRFVFVRSMHIMQISVLRLEIIDFFGY